VQKAHHDIKVISSVLELYKLDKFGYPDSKQGLEVLVSFLSLPPGTPSAPKVYKSKNLALREPGFKYKYSLPHGSLGSVFKYGPTNTSKPCLESG
jgi:hypothetical protein